MIIRVHRRRSYTVVENDAIRNPKLSWKATGLLVYLLSLPDNWEAKGSDLVNRKTDGKASVYSALQELEDAGYIRRRHVRRDGKTVIETVVFERPRKSKSKGTT